MNTIITSCPDIQPYGYKPMGLFFRVYIKKNPKSIRWEKIGDVIDPIATIKALKQPVITEEKVKSKVVKKTTKLQTAAK